MNRIFASVLAISLAFGGFASDAALAAPTGLPKPVFHSPPTNIDTVAYRHHYRRYGHHRHYRRYGPHYGGGAAAAAMFGSIVGSILSNPCNFGDCGYYDYGDYGYYPGYYGGYGGYGGGGHGGGGHARR